MSFYYNNTGSHLIICLFFGEKITSHYAFGKSAMTESVKQGPLFGRPYGGVSILIKNELCVFSVRTDMLLPGLETGLFATFIYHV